MTVAIRKSAMNFFVGPNMVREGLVVHLDPRNPKSYPGSGATVFDISRQGAVCNATFSGGYTITPEGMLFDGINALATFPQPSLTYKSTGIIQQWSVGFFIKPNNQSGWLFSPNSAGSDHYINYSVNSGGRMSFQVTEANDVNNRSFSSTAASVPVLDRWTYVVCTLNDITMRIYINGVLNATRINDVPVANWAGTWVMGRRAAISSAFYRGLLDNVHIYNRTLSEAEIKRNFNAFKGRYPNLRKRD